MRHLGDALETVRTGEYARLTGKHWRVIKGEKYALLSWRENLTTKGEGGPECATPCSVTPA
jgi:transposase